MKTSKRNLWLAIGALLIIYLVGSRLRTAFSPYSGTVPTCSSCSVSWGPNPTIAVGTVNSMTRSYSTAEIRTDLTLPTEQRFPIGLPVNGSQFSTQLFPAPGTKPLTANLVLCWNYLGAHPCDVISGFIIH